jgi:hypothetical protein
MRHKTSIQFCMKLLSEINDRPLFRRYDSLTKSFMTNPFQVSKKIDNQ